MAFPQVVTTSTGTGSGTSHVIAMPAGVTTGDLVAVFFVNDGNATVSVTSGTGWSQMASDANGTNVRLTQYRKVADGSGDNLTLGTSASELSVHAAYRITGHDAGTAPAIGSPTTGSSAFPDPPSLDPAGWGAEDTLWIAIAGWDGTLGNLVTHSEASNQVTQTSGGSPSNSCFVSVSTAAANATSRDPASSEVTTASDGWVAHTIAVRPAGAASSFQPAVSSDDSRAYGVSTFSAIDTVIQLGSSLGESKISWWRFPGVTVPQGAVISSARIGFVATTVGSASTVTVYGNDIDNAVAPTSFAEAWGMAITTATVAWAPGANTANVRYYTDDIAAVVQEIVDRSGWASGNAMMLAIHDTAGATSGPMADTVDSGNAHTILEITYDAGGGSGITVTLLGGL